MFSLFIVFREFHHAHFIYNTPTLSNRLLQITNCGPFQGNISVQPQPLSPLTCVNKQLHPLAQSTS